MAINPGSIGSVSVYQNHKTVIEILADRPTVGIQFADGIARTPGQLVGYFNAVIAKVEVFCVDATGLKPIKLG